MNITGWKTAMTRKKVSAPTKFLIDTKLLKGDVIDYGCGKGYDCNYLKCDGYDPYYRDVTIKDHYDTGICHYVLNVVDPKKQKEVLKNLQKLTDIAYVTVRRDLPPEGKEGKGCWQYYVELNAPIVHKETHYVIYKLDNKKSPKNVFPPNKKK